VVRQHERPGYIPKAVAWAKVVDPHGGMLVPGFVVADALDALRGMLPPGFTRCERRP